MKSKFLILVGSSLFSSGVFAVGGVGDIVSDPTSYAYYVKQIEAAQQQYEKATEHLNTALETKDTIESVDRQLRGNYNRAMRHIKKFQQWKENAKESPLEFAEDTIRNRDAVLDYSDKIENSIDSYYYGEDILGDNTNSKGGWVNINVNKNQHKQGFFKRALVKSEVAKGMINLDLDELEELATEVNSTQTLKDSSDVNSSILLKLLESAQRTNALLADISSTLAIANYSGEKQYSDNKRLNQVSSNDELDALLESNSRSSSGKLNGGVGMMDFLDGCNPFKDRCNK
jgi:hypothetical protein